MKTVYYPNMFHDVMLKGVLVKEDDSYYYLVEPLAYDWLAAINKLNWIDSLRTIQLEKSYYTITPSKIPPSHKEEDCWIFSLPVETPDELHYFVHFFEHFLDEKGTIYARAKTALENTQKSIPYPVLESIFECLCRKFPSDLGLRGILMLKDDL